MDRKPLDLLLERWAQLPRAPRGKVSLTWDVLTSTRRRAMAKGEEPLQAIDSAVQIVDLSVDRINLDLGYVFIDPDAQADEFGGREELNWTLYSRLSKYWSVYGGTRVDIEAQETRDASIGLTYDDECFMIQTVGRRSFFSDREIEPEDSVYVNFVFKHLGGVTGAGAGGG